MGRRMLDGLVGALIGSIAGIAWSIFKVWQDRKLDTIFAARLLSYLATSLRESLERKPLGLRHISLDLLVPHLRAIVAHDVLRRNLFTLQDYVLRWQAGGFIVSSHQDRENCRNALDDMTAELSRIAEGR
jgi:hypothetical protein